MQMSTSTLPEPYAVLETASTHTPLSVLNSSSIPSRMQEGRVLNETEKEALQNILFALFLESPRRKAFLSTSVENQQQKRVSTLNKQNRKKGKNQHE